MNKEGLGFCCYVDYQAVSLPKVNLTSRELQSDTTSLITRPWSIAFEERLFLMNFFLNVAKPATLILFLSLKRHNNNC